MQSMYYIGLDVHIRTITYCMMAALSTICVYSRTPRLNGHLRADGYGLGAGWF